MGINYHLHPLQEPCENMKLLLEINQHEKYNWNICGNLNVTAISLGYTKFCFLCEWNGRDRKHHCIQNQWPKREREQKYIANTPLTNAEKIYLPPSHIKLRLRKKFVQGMEQNSAGFMYLKDKFSRIRDAKIKGGVFVGPQIRKRQCKT
jgi:hypothetical protein